MKKTIKNTILSLTLGASLVSMSVPANAATNDKLLASLDEEPAVMQLHSQEGEVDHSLLDVFASYFLKKLNLAHAAEIAAVMAAAAPAAPQQAPASTPAPTAKPAATAKPKASKAPEKKKPQVTTSSSSGSKTIKTPDGEKKYKKKISVRATAYSADPKENGQWGPVDYFGNPLVLGTIAVDPSVIPMGSKVYITGYSSSGLPGKGMIAKASDMGSSINGNRIDIFVPGSSSIAKKFGIQNVEVYVL
ncbi:3D domain-containing protein [Paenibacillus sp. N1-5-1-14]|uniref:3D domain-containing protein n=1 Tax=Paenibacillus radicibacter TaxID=2972488 RepID=UPI0021594A20|nr:3D domain-containing protein [Paenibacillus radicibacter]MCR8643687.1 3D domain-containing protein [Paenibacillus radicibacter]